MNFQPLRCALTAISISSTVVLSSQPPDSSNALILQTPAVPLKPKKLRNTPFTCCSTSKWKHKLMFCSLVRRFSSLFTNDHLAWTSPSSGFPCKQITQHSLLKISSSYNQISKLSNKIKILIVSKMFSINIKFQNRRLCHLEFNSNNPHEK